MLISFFKVYKFMSHFGQDELSASVVLELDLTMAVTVLLYFYSICLLVARFTISSSVIWGRAIRVLRRCLVVLGSPLLVVTSAFGDM